MDKLVIGNKSYDVPQDFTLGKWKRLQTVWDDQKLISDGYDIPMEEVELIPEKTLTLAKVVLTTFTNLEHEPKDLVNGHKVVDFKKLTVGEWVDIELYLTRGIQNSICEFAGIIYDCDVDDTWLYSDVIGNLLKFMDYRISLYKQYKSIFGEDVADQEVGENKQLKTPIQQIWYEVIMLLADGKFLNIEPVTKRPIIEALNWVSWDKKNKKEEQYQLQKQQQELKAKYRR